MEAMREVEAAARSEIVSTLSEVHQEMEPHINGIIGHLRALSGIEVDDAQTRVRCRACATAHRPLPRPLIRGVVNG